jgi:kynurenine formamidase
MTGPPQEEPISLGELLDGCPKNWGRWGDDDEVGALNFLTPASVVAAAVLIRRGAVFTLQLPMADPRGDPVWPGGGRRPAQRINVRDKGHVIAGVARRAPGGIEGCDDVISCSLQGSTQYDALGHAWYGDQLYNGFDAMSTIGGMRKASVLPIAERGVVGRAVLLDVARWRGKDSLERGETFDHEDLDACAAAQGVELRARDILMIRTGWIELFERDPDAFYGGGRGWLEPGLQFSRGLVDWFHEREIPNLVTDTMANEVTEDPVHHVTLPLHVALMSNLGITFTEIASLRALGDDCAADGVYEMFYAAAPLKVVHAAGSPVNPIAIK